MSDYYSYKPLTKLDRPVALVGFPGCRPMQTARVAAMITGVPILMLPRAVTHHVGKTPEGLIIDGEEATLHGAEHAMLEKSLAARSNPIIALGPTTLEDPELQNYLRERCRLVHLSQTLTEAVLSIEAEMKEDRRKHRHLDRYAPIGAATLRPLFDQRTALFRDLCDDEIQVRGRAPLRVGRELPDALGWTVTA